MRHLFSNKQLLVIVYLDKEKLSVGLYFTEPIDYDDFVLTY